MKKYDCSKSKDLIHEYRRLCDDNETCYSCPIFKTEWVASCHMEDLSGAELEMIQRWSDEHPEKPKLRQVEYRFIKVFNPYEFPCYNIHRNHDGELFVSNGYVQLKLNPWEFLFIKKDEKWSFEELLELEIEDE